MSVDARRPPEIRPVSKHDAEAVAMLLGELGYPCNSLESASRIERPSTHAGSGTLVACDDAAVIGLISFEDMYYFPSDSIVCRVTALVVSNEARRRGIARLLLEAVVQSADARGVSTVEVTTSTSRDDAHRFYEDCGFRKTSYRYVRDLSTAGTGA